MEKLLNILTLSFLFICSIPAQTIVADHGSTSIVVNPDGTHSTAINNGITSLVINADGSHSVIANPNWGHSIAIDNGSTTTVINSDGTHSSAVNNDNTLKISKIEKASIQINSADSLKIVKPSIKKIKRH